MGGAAEKGSSARGGYAPHYFAALAQVEDRHFWFTSRNELLVRLLQPMGSWLPPGARVLEVGAGTGNTLRALERAWPRARIVGMDLFRDGFGVARSRATAPLVQASLEQLPFAERFDAVAAFDVFEHIADDRQAFRTVAEILNPGGLLVLTVPALQRLWSPFDEEAYHCRRYESDELQTKLLDAGFRIERQSFVMATLYPLMRVARVLQRHRTGSPGARELKVLPLVNPALKGLLAIESRMIAAGYQPPVGTSLVAITRRGK